MTTAQPSPDRWIVKATLLFTSTFTVMAGATISPALREMQTAFADVENAEFWVRLVLTLPALFIVLGAPIAGWIVDRYGRKTLLLMSVILYGFAGGSGFVAPTLPVILIGRALLGLSVAGLMTSVTTLITDYFVGERRAAFLGIQAGFMGLGGTVFLTLGGVLAQIDWRNPFLIYLTAFLAVPFISRFLFEPDRTPAATDAATAANRDPQTVPVGLMMFIYILMIYVQIVFYLIPIEFSFYLNALVGAEGGVAGAAIAAATLFFSIGSLQFGRIKAHFGHLQILSVGLFMVGIGYLMIGLASGWPLLILGLPLAGFGLGITAPNLNVWLANSVPDSMRGRALGLFTTSLFLGQFLSPIVTAPITSAGSVALTFELLAITTMLLAGVIFFANQVQAQRMHHPEPSL